jgi:hypothetical protein
MTRAEIHSEMTNGLDIEGMTNGYKWLVYGKEIPG